MGPPGSGKGTQVSALKQDMGFESIDTGGMLRALSREDSPRARQVKVIIDSGRLAPPPLVARIVTERVVSSVQEGKSVALEGSPRTLHEAEILLKTLRAEGIHDILVVFLDVPKPETVQRILQRWVCEACKRSTMLPVDVPEQCPACGGRLVKRVDDTLETSHKRWEEYRFRTLPVIQFFQRQGLVAHVNGHQSIPDVTQEVHAAVRGQNA
ncbi:MAG: adenylate kinase [Parcubacteria group bacterium Gr01-1014_106]|nr:MAG: adenylate kinase [Parcubacteria group bacterium Gr01-1014_106]